MTFSLTQKSYQDTQNIKIPRGALCSVQISSSSQGDDDEVLMYISYEDFKVVLSRLRDVAENCFENRIQELQRNYFNNYIRSLSRSVEFPLALELFHDEIEEDCQSEREERQERITKALCKALSSKGMLL